MTIDVSKLNDCDADTARYRLTTCCGAVRWVEAMLARRPFSSAAEVVAAGDEIWSGLGEEDWLEAFAHHPRIGDVATLREKFARTADLSAAEQAGVSGADEEVLLGLKDGNDAYFEKFGFVFLICATGKSAAEMLAALEARLSNDRATELANAAAEHSKITRIRLEKL